jgi:ABC-type multidrug transport system ATPase subunit
MLRIENLVKVYPGPVSALQGVSLEVEKGLFGLLGPNGAGKTTLMRIVAGLLEPTSGTVTFDGRDVVAEPLRIWGDLGYLPQDFGFYPNLSGEAMLEYLLKLKGVEAPNGHRTLARELLGLVGLGDAAKRKLKGYSGGMRQRLGIAQAMAGDPKLIIVDEPTAGLDPEERLRFYRMLAELAETRTVVLSTHIVEDVAVLCNRFAVIRKGKLVADTSPSAAKAALEGEIFEGTASGSELEEIARSCRVTQAVLREGTHRVRVHSPEKTPPDGFEPVEPTIEDAYLLLMQQDAVAVGTVGGNLTHDDPPVGGASAGALS